MIVQTETSFPETSFPETYHGYRAMRLADEGHAKSFARVNVGDPYPLWSTPFNDVTKERELGSGGRRTRLEAMLADEKVAILYLAKFELVEVTKLKDIR